MCNFTENYDKWVAEGKPNERQLSVCVTSEALTSIGVEQKNIVWDTSKINKIQRDHLGMSDDVLKNVSEVISDPIIVMDSKTQPNRVTVFGDLCNDNGIPIMVVLALRPIKRNNTVLNAIKIASVYARDNDNPNASIVDTQRIIDTSQILYIDPDIIRTATWLSHNQLQLPFEITEYGSIDKVAYLERDVNGNFSSPIVDYELPEWKKILQKWDSVKETAPDYLYNFSSIYVKLNNILDNMINNYYFDGRAVFLFGHCDATEEIANYLHEHDVSIKAILDNNKSKQGLKYRNIPITKPELVKNYKGYKSVVLITSQFHLEMYTQLCEFGYKGDVIQI